MDDLSRYKELKATILYHNDRYYNQDNQRLLIMNTIIYDAGIKRIRTKTP
ncbi:MAG: hypothetical protein ACLSGM_04070 [Thomasclavelia sp.]